MDVGRQKLWKKIAILKYPSQPFRTKWTLDVKNSGKIAILKYPSQPFRTKRWTSKTVVKLRFWSIHASQPFSHEMDVGRQKLRLNCDF